jgi:AraC family transcriptional regulator
MMAAMRATSRARRAAPTDARRRLADAIGRDVARFQENTYAFDDVAAEVLALQRSDLPAMTLLLFGGPASADALSAALHIRRPMVAATLERLQLAGYARAQPGSDRVELTAHARTWIGRIWASLQEDGDRILGSYSTAHLTVIAGFIQQACASQEARTAALRQWLALPSSPAKRPHLKGGLSPAALQRVQVYVEANLAASIPLRALAARAALSPYHFARAFKTSTGMPPRTFVESRRVERARQLLAGSQRPIAEVAIETGFGTQSRLTTVFKRHTGFAPAAYRRGRSG